jgi:type II secretory pathway component PulF
METMVTGGLPLTEGFTLTARTCGSGWYDRRVLQPAVDRIRSGESVCASLKGSPGLPASFFGLLVAGEESGRLDHSFGYLSDLYEMELVNAVETFLAALEPLSIAVVGVVVLGVLVSVFAPLSKLLSAV